MGYQRRVHGECCGDRSACWTEMTECSDYRTGNKSVDDIR